MADDSAAKLLLIVTGSTLRAEEVDRPLAYYLRQRIEQSLAESDLDAGPFRVQVVADFRWIHDDPLQAAEIALRRVALWRATESTGP